MEISHPGRRQCSQSSRRLALGWYVLPLRRASTTVPNPLLLSLSGRRNSTLDICRYRGLTLMFLKNTMLLGSCAWMAKVPLDSLRSPLTPSGSV